MAGFSGQTGDQSVLLGHVGSHGSRGQRIGRLDEHGRHHVGHGGQGLPSRTDDLDHPAATGLLECGDNPGAHKAGLAHPRRAHNSQKGLIAQPSDGGSNIAIAAKEPMGIRFLKDAQARVGALIRV